MDRPFAVCVIGAGRAGLIHARNFRQGVPGACLAGLVEPDAAGRAAAAVELPGVHFFDTIEQAVGQSGVDAVVVTTPTVHHLRIAREAAAAGKHIFCEKPMAMSAGECRAMMGAVEQAGVKLQIGFMRRFDRHLSAAHAAAARGDVGQVVAIKSLTHGPSVPRPWQYDIVKSNGTLAEVNSHDIDTIRWFSGSEFEEVYAVAGNYRCQQAHEQFPDYYDNFLLVARMANGTQGLIDGAASVHYGYDSRVEVLGTTGVLFAGDLRADATSVCVGGRVVSPVVQSWRDLFAEAYVAEAIEFIDAIRQDRPPRVGGADGLAAVRVVEAGNRSIRERRPVNLSEIE